MTFGQRITEAREARDAQAKERKARNLAALLTKPSSPVAGTYANPGVFSPLPKTEPKRNPHLLAMANGMPCLMRVDGVCNGDKRTTVAAHSNLSIHGKAKGRKADDQYSVWACAACHGWLDQGKAGAVEKERAFMAGHVRQVEAWRGIATHDPFIKDRDAAQWALDQLAATPIGETA